MTLLQISQDCIIENEKEIILWPIFGSKTDSATHRQSGWLLTEHPNARVCPVRHIKQLIQLSEQRRIEKDKLNSLFITVTKTVKPATRTIIAGWIKSIFKEAEVNASPGSIRSAVASREWHDNRPIEEILRRGNWKSMETFSKYNCRQIKSTDNNTSADLLNSNFSDI